MSETDYSFPFTWLRWPLSGDVIQNISPEFSRVEIAGNAEIERRVVREVASYGNQLDTILDVVDMLARDLDQTDPRVTALYALIEKVDAIKQQEKDGARERAQQALDALKKVDSSGYESLMAARKPDR
ncbi:hypothetical protein ACN2XU_21630 [Primorskyibacter sp. 2E107]|uniref:hypothetical protein n=1 Tax=Primorskyibacter sp. 2E107 TaxID=3403458 RepID=UPI003AF6E381